MSVQSASDQNPVAYRGEDRRRVAGPVQSPIGRPYVLAVLVVVLTGVAATLTLQVPVHWVPEARELIQVLQVASLMVAVAVGGLAVSRWYLTSDAPALWIGVALLFYGIARLGIAELSPLVVSETAMMQWVVWLRPASQVIVIVLLGRAVTLVPVSSEISGPKLLLGALGGLVLVAAVLRFAPPAATLIDGAAAAFPRGYGNVNQVGIVPVAFLLLTVMFTLQGYRRRRWLFTWLGLLLLSIAVGEVTRVITPPPVEAGLLGKELLRLLGLLLALHGGVREILYTYRDNSTRLARSEYTAMAAREHLREGQAAAEERAHEARSALAAIEGATKTLEHYRDRLPNETRAALSTAISGEIRRLQNLVSADQTAGEIGPFSLAESLSPLIASERARGVEVDLRVAGDLVTVGNAAATEQVLQALFDNARRHAPGTRITVRAERENGWVVLRIQDRGAGVPADQREAIFRRGVRGDAALDVPGSGLGLYVAAKLMQEQDGELWVDERPAGGASFAVALPAADSDVGSSHAPVDDLRDADNIAPQDGVVAARRVD